LLRNRQLQPDPHDRLPSRPGGRTRSTRLYGRDFEFVAYRQNWARTGVHLHDVGRQLFSAASRVDRRGGGGPVHGKSRRAGPRSGTAGLLGTGLTMVDRFPAGQRTMPRAVKKITAVNVKEDYAGLLWQY